MKILGFEKLSLVDFNDKVGCTIFLGNCNFRCPYCHNSTLVLNEVNEEISFDEVKSYLTKRKGIIEAICITGGEPTLACDLYDSLTELKNMGFYLKLDTNGTNFPLLKRLIENKVIDYVAMDIKNSFSNYERACGVKCNLDNIKKSINYLIEKDFSYEFRITLTEELTDFDDIKEIGEILEGAKQLFLQKYISRETCFDKTLTAVPIDKVKLYQEELNKKIKCVSLRNY